MRTIPNTYPLVRPDEAWTGQIFKASMARKIAQAQNYLWANMRCIYAMGGVEGHGSKRIFSWSEQPGIVNLPDGSTALPLVTFMVPRNWAGGSTMRIKGDSTHVDNLIKNWSAPRVTCWLYDLDGTPTGVNGTSSGIGSGTFSFDLAIPQDKDLRYATVYLRVNGFTSNQGGTYDSLQVNNISARYVSSAADFAPAYSYVRNALEQNPPTPVWTDRVAVGDVYDSIAAASVFWDWLINNTNAIWFERNPELCQSQLRETQNNTTSATEVCRYYVYVGRGVGSVTVVFDGYRDTTANGSWAIKCNGVSVATGSVLSAGAYQATATFTPLPGEENTITIETSVASTVAGKWGMLVWNVSAWEHNISLPDDTGVSYPTAYAPLEEDALQGDGPARLDHFNQLLANQRWLFKNRPRHLIGDCFHKTYKRAGTRTQWTTQVDPYVDWTPGFPDFAYQLGAPKNMTVMPEGIVIDATNVGGLAGSPNGLASMTTYSDTMGSNGFPNYADQQAYLQHGLTLARVRMGLNSSEDRIVRVTSGRVCVYARPRRAKTAQFITGLEAEEGYFDGQHKLYLYCAAGTDIPGATLGVLPIMKPDLQPRWIGNDYFSSMSVGVATYATLLVNGFVPKPVSYFNGGGAGVARPRGTLFETELTSLYVADRPLTMLELDAL